MKSRWLQAAQDRYINWQSFQVAYVAVDDHWLKRRWRTQASSKWNLLKNKELSPYLA